MPKKREPKVHVPMSWSALDTAYARAKEALDQYMEEIIKSVPKNPGHMVALCQLDNARVHLRMAEVKSRPRPKTKKKKKR